MGKIDDVLASIARTRQDAQSAHTALLTAATQARQLETAYAALCALGDRSRVEQLCNQLAETIGEVSPLSTQTEKIAAGFELIKGSGGWQPATMATRPASLAASPWRKLTFGHDWRDFFADNDDAALDNTAAGHSVAELPRPFM